MCREAWEFESPLPHICWLGVVWEVQSALPLKGGGALIGTKHFGGTDVEH